MAKEKVLTDVRDIIMDKMKSEGRALSWLSREAQISYDTLYSCLRDKKFSLSDDNLGKINKALGTTYEQA